MAKPNKKGPTKTVDIHCAKCRQVLFKYRKGGKGALLKCFKERIVKDYTLDQISCPGCKQIFARDCLIRGVPALKMIGTKAICR
ncbi:MAG: hypothetical protein OFPI_20760 [Osedax symbiont Rs2]|nr:MAG: hypothetical protein OFPI_20760 [Osedax symbiont Rs2]